MRLRGYRKGDSMVVPHIPSLQKYWKGNMDVSYIGDSKHVCTFPKCNYIAETLMHAEYYNACSLICFQR